MRLAAIALRGPQGDDADWLVRYASPDVIDLATLEASGHRHRLRGADVRVVGASEETRLARISAGSDALICRRAPVGAAELAASPNLRVVARLGSDSAGLDLPALDHAGVHTVCMERPSLAFTAEHAVLMMLAATKDIVIADRLSRDPEWDRTQVHPIDNVAYNWPGLSGLGGLFGATIGMIGMGQVGLLVAERLRLFGAKLLYTKRSRLPAAQEAALGLTFVDSDTLLARSDIVSLHARWTPETERMMNAETFARMKPGAIFVNTSRGYLVDEAALAEALHAGHIFRAALDTHAPEPRDPDAPLTHAPNTIFTPHIAGGSRGVLAQEVDMLLGHVAAALSSPDPMAQV
ncbi:2-hydroxyacid dehydrogenase [Pseudooceanicola sp. C21-150M6]|uniref:2-hydroxyacid dehydrogenase n=1 Tax=Pseudooceanicola sp. C21-150M6 TaxID=3434355 RepID=UPI003D7FABEA